MTRYYAMNDGTQTGPWALEELPGAGVRPDTYVWCKGMADWEHAGDVEEIRNYYRRRIGEIRSRADAESLPSPASALPPAAAETQAGFPGMLPPFQPEQPDTGQPPPSTLFLSIVLMLFCFPLTGLVAVYFSYKARTAWEKARRSTGKNSKGLYTDAEREKLAREAHDYSRSAKMWCGITFFMGVMMTAFMARTFL